MRNRIRKENVKVSLGIVDICCETCLFSKIHVVRQDGSYYQESMLTCLALKGMDCSMNPDRPYNYWQPKNVYYIEFIEVDEMLL